MNELNNLTQAAAKAAMSEKTARKYLRSGQLPSEMKRERTKSTRPDPFVEDWEEVRGLLKETPGLQALEIFRHLQRQNPGRYQDGQLRTLQRRIREWRALEGPTKEVYFSQEHRPGELSQSDFTRRRIGA